MKASVKWNQAPVARLFDTEKKSLPYVCAVSPFENGFRFEWFDRGSCAAHKVIVHKRESYEAVLEYDISSPSFEINGLERDVTYEFTVWRSDMSASSATRLVRTGISVGKAINYIHPEDTAYSSSGKYLGTPTLCRLPSGRLLAGMDIFGDADDGQHIAILFRSEDNGESWRYVTELSPCFWPRFFVNKGKLYCLAVAEPYGDLIIGCSSDEGDSWSEPVHLVHGVKGDYGCHRAGNPVINSNGCVYTAFEYGTWKYRSFYHSLLWAAEDADLMKPESWHFTEPAGVNKNFEGMPRANVVTAIEGNAVALPDGEVAVLLRIDPLNMIGSDRNKALLVRRDTRNIEGKLLHERVIDMPCGFRNKFCVRYDADSGKYIALCNEYTEDGFRGRAVLTLAASDDCVNWTSLKRVIDARNDIKVLHRDISYSYPDFDFDGDDIIVILRVAANGAKNGHDTNLISFVRIKNYKRYL